MIDNVSIVFYGDNKFARARQRFNSEAKNFGFKKIFNFGLENLPQPFLNENKDFIYRNKRGGGYWLWKSYLVNYVLNGLKYGEFLLYADVGCTLNLNGKKRFDEYVQMTDMHSMLNFQMGHIEHMWTKQSLIQYLNCQEPHIVDSGQMVGGIFMVKKTSWSEGLIKQWYDICNLKWTIDDSPSSIPNHPNFKDHRHDQSVLSLLVKKNKSFFIPDESFGINWDAEPVKNSPILATRKN